MFKSWKVWLLSAFVAVGSVTAVSFPLEAEAKRLGGGRASGMQRQMPPKQPDATPNKATSDAPQQAGQPGATQAAATGGAAAAAQQAGKRSWMGPIAGLAAGLGLAALMSHLGMGEAFANFLMMALLGVAALFLVTWLMRRFRGAPAAGPQLAGAGAPVPMGGAPMASNATYRTSATSAPHPAPASVGGGSVAAASVPAGFDAQGFERIAKMIFIRLQAANDERNLDDLRKFTTPELFASLRLDLQERGDASQQTDVVQLDAQLVDTAQEDGQWVASVRFSGLIREEAGQDGAHPFDELWHLVRPVDGSREWAIAGITPLTA